MQNETQQNPALLGGNTLRRNQATMIEAVEYWLNTVVLRQPVKVRGIKELSDVLEASVIEREDD